MTESLSRAARSELMSRVRQSGTAPELAVRSALHKAGLRFRVNVRKLPGSPDLVLPRFDTVVFVHGCFWHRHSGCKLATTPASHSDYWQAKFDANVKRDRRKTLALRALGWRVLIVWQCEVTPPRLSRLATTIRHLRV